MLNIDGADGCADFHKHLRLAKGRKNADEKLLRLFSYYKLAN